LILEFRVEKNQILVMDKDSLFHCFLPTPSIIIKLFILILLNDVMI